MYPMLYAIVQVTLDYLPVLLIPWVISATTTAMLLRGWGYDMWFVCLIPGLHTPIKVYYVTGKKWVFASIALFLTCLFTRSTVGCLAYIVLVTVYNVVFTLQSFNTPIQALAVLGLFRMYVYWREVIECLRCNKAKNTKRKTTVLKRTTTPNTKTKNPNSR